MTLAEAYNYGVYFLSANGVDEAEFKALCLCCHCAGLKNSEYEIFQGLPKADKMELVIQKAKVLENPVILDLCAGSGCIGISVARAVSQAMVYCVEKSEKAMLYLLKNSENDKNVKVLHADISNPPDMPFADIIVSNPPYIKSGDIADLQSEVLKEPLMALDGGADGLDFYRIIAQKWYSYLKKGGMLFLEIGEDQGDKVSAILENYGFSEIKVLNDMYGNNRMVTALK